MYNGPAKVVLKISLFKRRNKKSKIMFQISNDSYISLNIISIFIDTKVFPHFYPKGHKSEIGNIMILFQLFLTEWQ